MPSSGLWLVACGLCSYELFFKKIRYSLNISAMFDIISTAIEMADLPAVRVAGSGEQQVIVSADTSQNPRFDLIARFLNI